jgi:hypothetical protein
MGLDEITDLRMQVAELSRQREALLAACQTMLAAFRYIPVLPDDQRGRKVEMARAGLKDAIRIAKRRA